MNKKIKLRFKQLISSALTVAMLVSVMQFPVHAEKEAIYLPEDDISEELLSDGSFYLGTSNAEIEENADTSYLLKVGRGGESLPEAAVRLNIIDITAKYGDDYKIRIYNNSAFGDGVQNARKSRSLLEEITDNADEIEEVNYSDGVVSDENIDAESAAEMLNEDVETFNEYLSDAVETSEEQPTAEPAESIQEATAEPEAQPTAEPTAEPEESIQEATAEPEAQPTAEPTAEPEENAQEATAEPEAQPTAEPTAAPEVTDDSGSEAQKTASSLRSAKELATGLESDRTPMDGGGTFEAYTMEMLSTLSEDLESAYLMLDFAEGESEKYVEIIPKDNSDGDGDRMFTANLFAESDNAAISSISGINVTIKDDEVQEPATISFAESEYYPQDGYIKVKLVRDGAINQMVAAKLTTEDDTAVKDRDYSQVDTTVAFPYGVTERTVNIPIRSDYISDTAEFKIKLSDAANCNIGAVDTAYGVINAGTESFSLMSDDSGEDEADAENDDTSADVSLMADATTSSIILGDKVDLKSAYGVGVSDGGYSRANGDEYEMYAQTGIYDSVSAWANWSMGDHYDVSGIQIEWTKESGKPCYSDTYVEFKNHDTSKWETIWSTSSERWGKRTNNIFFPTNKVREYYIELTREGSFFGKSPTLKIHSIKPILRPFEISLVGADPLYYLNENGDYVANTSIAKLNDANRTVLQNASNTGTGTVVKFSGDTFTVTSSSPYSYISGLKIVNSDTGASKLIKSNLAVGTQSVSVKLTNDFIKDNLSYVTFANNGSNGKKGQFKVQAVMEHYDSTVNIYSDYRGSVTIGNEGEDGDGDFYEGESGYFYIKNLNSGLYLESESADGQGAVVQNTNESERTIWYLDCQDDGYYSIKNVATGYMMDVSNASSANGTRIITYSDNGTVAQRFSIKKQSDGSYAILTKASSEKSGLDVEGASTAANWFIQQYEYVGGANQKWIIEKADVVTDGIYRIKNLSSGLYLRPNGTGETSVIQSDDDKYLNWTVTQLSDGTYSLKNESGYMLDVQSASASDGTPLTTYHDNGTSAQRFMLRKQSDGSYAILTKTTSYKSAVSVKDGSGSSGAAVVQQTYNGGKGQYWVLEPVSEAQSFNYHKGDTIRFTQNIYDEYASSYTGSRIRLVTKDTSTSESVDNKRAYDNGTNSCTIFNTYSNIDIYPNFDRRDNHIIVRVAKDDVSKFDTGKGIFTSPSADAGDYMEYTVVGSEDFAAGIYYEFSARPAQDGYVPVWQPIHKDTKYSQNTFYFESTDEIEENILYLTCEKADSQKYVLTGNAYYSDVSLNGSSEGTAWMPASGVYVLMGPENYGMSKEDGTFNTIGMYGINGRSVIYKTVASGITEYKTAVLSNEKTSSFGDDSTSVVKAYDVNIGTVKASTIDKTVPYVTSVVAANTDNVESGVVSINDGITMFTVTLNNNHSTYTDTDGKEREEKVTAVDLLVYDGQTNMLKKTISGAVQASDYNGMSVWTMSNTFAKGKPTEYAASDKLYVRVTTDRVIGNGKSLDADGNEVENEALESTEYAPVYTGYTFVESNTQEPVTHDIDVDTNMDFIKLPLIGSMDATFNIKKISFSISELPNGGQRLSIGYINKSAEEVEQASTADDGVKYGVKDIKAAFNGIKNFGETSGDKSNLGMKSWGLYPIFGVYLDFGLKNVYYTENTSKKLVFIGGGLYLGATGEFRLVQYFVVGWVPFYMGVNGALSLYNQAGITAINEDTATSDRILTEENAFAGSFAPEWCLQANGTVAAYVGAGLCGTLGVRGGIQFDANYIYNPTIKYKYPTYHENGLILSASIRVWVDALLFSIPIPVVNLLNQRYGYYEDVQEENASLFSAEGENSTEISMRPRTSGSSEWLPNGGDVQLMSTFEEAGSTVLLENGYDRADPQLLDIGNGRILLTFLADDSTRTDENRTALMYSIYENGVWSQPVKVQDDATADFEPNLCDAGDKVLISWTSRCAEAAYTNEADYLKTLDVYTVTLDKESLELGNIECLTNDNFYDSAPVGLYDDETGDMLVYYLKSEVSDDFEASVSPAVNGSVIVYMLYDASQGKWARDYYYDNEVASEDAEETLIREWGGQRFLSSPIKDFEMTDPVIMDFDAISYNGIGLYTYTVDEDNNLDTDADRELFVQAYDFAEHKTYVPVRITNDNLSDSIPQLVRNGENTYLFWLENNADIRYIDVSDLIKNGVTADGGIDPEYELNYGVVFFCDTDGGDVNPTFGSYKAFVDADGNLFIIWLQPVTNEDGTSSQEVFASALIHEGEATSWSDGVQLTHSGQFNDEVALTTDADGNLITVSNQYSLDLSEDESGVKDIKLIATNYNIVGSLDVTDISYSNDTPKAGEEIEATVNIKNTGLRPAKGYTLNVYEMINGEKGEQLFTVTSDESIAPSSSAPVSFNWTMPESYDNIDSLSLYAEVTEAEMTEVSEFTDDGITIAPAYEITDYKVTEREDGFYIDYTVRNVGNAPSRPSDAASDDKVVVEFNDIYYTGEDVAPYLEAPIGGLEIDESKTYTMELDIADDRFEFGYTNAYIEVQDKDDKTLSDSQPFIIELEYPYGIVINGDESLSQITLQKGESLELSAEYSPSEFYADAAIGYSVADTSVAYMNGDTIVANEAGETTLTAIIAPYGGSKTISVVVEGDENEPTPTPTPTPKPSPIPGPSGGGGSIGGSFIPQIPTPNPETVTGSFSDVNKSDWFFDSVEYAAEKGYFNGTSEGIFEPYTNVTRGMIVTVLGRLDGIADANTETIYSDVDSGAYYAAHIAWATENGIVNGYGDGTFGPDDLVTREQMAKMMANYLTYKTGVSAENTALDYTDAADISDWAAEPVALATQQGIMQGNDDGSFAPKGFATRAEAAAVIERLDRLIAVQE